MPQDHNCSYRCEDDFSELNEYAESDFRPQSFESKVGTQNSCDHRSSCSLETFDPKVHEENFSGHRSSGPTIEAQKVCGHRSPENRTFDPKVPSPVGLRAKTPGKIHFYDFADMDDFKTLTTHFISSKFAAKAGYFSKSHWKSKRRTVREGATPVFCVAKTWRTSGTKDGDIILSMNMMNTYEVTSRSFCPETGFLGCWDVFHKSDTVLILEDRHSKSTGENPKEHKPLVTVTNQAKPPTTPSTTPSSSTSISTTSTSSSYSPLPYDGGDIIEKHERDGKNQCRSPTSGGSRSRNVNKRKTAKPQSSRFVYFPENFQWTPELEKYRSTFMWFAHTLYQRRFVNNDCRELGKDEHVTVKSEYARKVAPKFRQMIEFLVKEDIVDRDHYQVGVKSYGYRFTDPALRSAKRTRQPLEDSGIVRRLNEHSKKQATTRNDRWLRSQLVKIGLSEVDSEFLRKTAGRSVVENGGRLEDKLEAYGYVLERISNQEHPAWNTDDQGRCYTLITNLKRELRSLLRVEGRQLQFIDIKNSQLTFLALEMKKHGVECEDFTMCCEQGQLYEHVAKHAKTTRKAVKKAITQGALFSPNSARCQRWPIKQTFDKLFPAAARFIHEQKDHQDGHSKFAKMLQAAEADLIINRVCGKLRRNSDVGFVTPVHDCLLFLPEDAETIKTVMEDEFEKIGLKPDLEVKELVTDA